MDLSAISYKETLLDVLEDINNDFEISNIIDDRDGHQNMRLFNFQNIWFSLDYKTNSNGLYTFYITMSYSNDMGKMSQTLEICCNHLFKEGIEDILSMTKIEVVNRFRYTAQKIECDLDQYINYQYYSYMVVNNTGSRIVISEKNLGGNDLIDFSSLLDLIMYLEYMKIIHTSCSSSIIASRFVGDNIVKSNYSYINQENNYNDLLDEICHELNIIDLVLSNNEMVFCLSDSLNVKANIGINVLDFNIITDIRTFDNDNPDSIILFGRFLKKIRSYKLNRIYTLVKLKNNLYSFTKRDNIVFNDSNEIDRLIDYVKERIEERQDFSINFQLPNDCFNGCRVLRVNNFNKFGFDLNLFFIPEIDEDGLFYNTHITENYKKIKYRDVNNEISSFFSKCMLISAS